MLFLHFIDLCGRSTVKLGFNYILQLIVFFMNLQKYAESQKSHVFKDKHVKEWFLVWLFKRNQNVCLFNLNTFVITNNFTIVFFCIYILALVMMYHDDGSPFLICIIQYFISYKILMIHKDSKLEVVFLLGVVELIVIYFYFSYKKLSRRFKHVTLTKIPLTWNIICSFDHFFFQESNLLGILSKLNIMSI